MSFHEAIEEASVSLDLKSDTKEGIIDEMLTMLSHTGKISDKTEALEAVMEREQKMSTGMQFGIAIPHGKTNAVSKLVTAIAIKKEGVDFSSFDGEPSRIFIMTLSPPNHAGPHIQYLSEVSKLLNVESIRERLLKAETESQIREIFAEDNAISAA